MNFGTKIAFRYLFCQLEIQNYIYIRMNFGMKVVFHYLFFQLEIQIVIHLIFQIVS